MMKKFIILHYGFVPPTPSDMDKWNVWFASIADREIEKGHLPSGQEISKAGVQALPLSRESITGYTMIKADSLDEATTIAQACPFVDATRVYEIMG